jgi:hypothetical protein
VQWVNRQGLWYNDLELHIELRDRAQMTKFLRESRDTRSLGAILHTTYTKNGRLVRTEVDGVAILRGLPNILFQGVTVHELGHAWLVVHSVTDLPPWAVEGFCELLAYRFYQGILTDEGRYHAQCIEQSTDPVYGDGFRRLHSLVQAVGFQHLIEVLTTTKQLPTIR